MTHAGQTGGSGAPSNAQVTCLPLDGEKTAKDAGLRYVSDTKPGVMRKRAGRGFRYVDPDGTPIRDPEALRRFNALRIPPAWHDVWICRSSRGHLQATGRDARGRKQYRYHAKWREVRDEAKYGRLATFGESLPSLRTQIEKDLRLPGLPREKLLATVVRLLDESLIRVGNEEYARENSSFGLTTLRNEHVDVSGSTIRFNFRGKSGKEHRLAVSDRRLAGIVKRCQELPGQELFQYLDDDGNRHEIGSEDVNEYLRIATGQDFSAKDFRTWGGSVIALEALLSAGPFNSQSEAKSNLVEAIRLTAERLRNTPAICRSCYVHPGLIDTYLAGALPRISGHPDKPAATQYADLLRPGELQLLQLLKELPVTGGAGAK